jgi:phosphoesterase RecJ-like protein
MNRPLPAAPGRTDKAAIDLIEAAQQLLLITHLAPDSDAIGSLLGLTLALRALGKQVTPACSDPVFDRYSHLPGHADIVSTTGGPFELVIALDCADESRLGQIWIDLPAPKPTLLNIDHHVTNTRFGQVNWIETTASATAEIVLSLIDQLQIELTPEIATCLLNGLVGDTLGFRTSSTTPHTLECAMRLLQAGAPLTDIMELQFNRRSLALIRLWGKALERLQLNDRIVYTTISKPLRDSCGFSGSSDISLASFLISANEADMSAVLVEKDDGRIDLSLRAKIGQDVARAAQALGGGGHPLAAGATIDGPLEAAAERVLQALKANRQ